VELTAVFDTNILFSATGWRGNPFHCVELARSGTVHGVTCMELMQELEEKLQTKLGFSAEQVFDALADYLTFLRLVRILKILNVVPRDPEDNMVIECALAARAHYIVTGDNDLLELARFHGIQIVKAASFMEIAQKR
jgi:putative PIN family toxin of toxin-antitoxin system